MKKLLSHYYFWFSCFSNILFFVLSCSRNIFDNHRYNDFLDHNILAPNYCQYSVDFWRISIKKNSGSICNCKNVNQRTSKQKMEKWQWQPRKETQILLSGIKPYTLIFCFDSNNCKDNKILDFFKKSIFVSFHDLFQPQIDLSKQNIR